jgi:peptide/nickel transport system ATP-binding protein
LLRIEALSKTYPESPHAALLDVHLQVAAGEFVAVVGRSGAGKSTLARCVAGFERPSSGMIAIDGRCQLLVQDSPLSLNPRWTVGRLLAEPFLIQGDPDPADRARDAAAAAGLPHTYLAQPIWGLSGGERQLVALSRALSVRGLALLIADEPFTGLDEAHQQKLAQRLAEESSRGLSILLVTHSLAWVRRLADRVVVLEAGRLVEDQPAGRFFSSPRHPASQALLAAQLEEAC